MARIGFIGLGHMGAPMVLDLLKAGHTLVVYDRVTAAIEALVRAGAMGASSIAEVGREADVVFTMLQEGEQVRAVSEGPGGLFETMKQGALLIDTSSIDLKNTWELTEMAAKRGLLRIDAPVSGGVNGAIKGSLTVMVGGEMEAVEAAMPYLRCVGQKIVHAGKAGTGQTAKICNNMILGISMIAISEAFVLGEKLGLSPDKLFEISSQSSGQCWAMTQYSPVPGLVENVPSNTGYQPGFSANMMLKDLKLSQNAAKMADLKTTLGEAATGIFALYVDKGCGTMDFSGVINLISEKT